MNAHGAMNIGCGFGDGAHGCKSLQPGGDGEEMADARISRARKHAIQLGRELRKIEMAMAVDKHDQPWPTALAISSTSHGLTARRAVWRWRSRGRKREWSGAVPDAGPWRGRTGR